MIGIANRAPAALIERARRLYTGVDPDTRARLTEADCARMAGAAIAEACGVHPHTVDGWIRRFGWSRPPWYRRRKVHKPVQPGAVAQTLVVLIESAAAAGTALADNVRLARAIGCSIQGVTAALRALRAAGTIQSERAGPARRLVLHDGRATAWARLVRGPAAPGKDPIERRSLAERVLEAVTGWAAAGAPMPTDAQGSQLLRCDSTSFRRALKQLREAGTLRVENTPHRRRFVLPDGRATGWSLGPMRVKPGSVAGLVSTTRAVRFGVAPLDLVAEEAVRALRRQGPVVFDLAVVTACVPGVAWSVDGRTMTHAQLVDEAARRNARAMQQLGAAP